MSISTSRLAYGDCFDAFNKALEDPIGIRIKVASENAATFLKMRMHQARAIDRKDNMVIHTPGDHLYGRSIYDPVRVTQDGDYLYLEKITLKGEIEALSEIPEYMLPAPEQLVIEASPAPLQIEHIRRRV